MPIEVPMWGWILIGVTIGIGVAALVGPRVLRVLRATPPPDLPEHLAPGWYAQCTRCGRAKTLASVGGIRVGGNRGAKKATLGWCRGCRALRFVRIVHQTRLDTDAAASA